MVKTSNREFQRILKGVRASGKLRLERKKLALAGLTTISKSRLKKLNNLLVAAKKWSERDFSYSNGNAWDEDLDCAVNAFNFKTKE